MKRLFLLALIIAVFLCGCDAGYSHQSAGASEFYDALTVIQSGVPYTAGMDLRLDTIHLLETDPYGRRLFSCYLALSQADVLLIVQKTEDPLVCYYEDDCYMIHQDPTGFTEEETAWLKVQNDWGQPLDDEQMLSVNFRETPPDYENIEEYQDVCKKVAADFIVRYPSKSWETAKISINGLESFEDHGQVILAECYFSDSKTSKAYLVLYDGAVIIAETIDGNNNFRESIIAFKDAYCRPNG